jgi:hypothetical protein
MSLVPSDEEATETQSAHGGRPVVCAVQLAPESEEVKSLSPRAAATSFVPFEEDATDVHGADAGNPPLCRVHVKPPSAEVYAPPL